MKNNNLNDGQTHKIFFSAGKLYLDGVQIAGEGMNPLKDIVFEFKTNTIQEEVPQDAPEFLEVNVFDAIKGKGVGPGQL